MASSARGEVGRGDFLAGRKRWSAAVGGAGLVRMEGVKALVVMRSGRRERVGIVEHFMVETICCSRREVGWQGVGFGHSMTVSETEDNAKTSCRKTRRSETEGKYIIYCTIQIQT